MRIGIIGDSQSQGLRRTLIPALEAKGYQITGAMTEVGMGLRNMRASPDRVSRARAVARGADTLLVIIGGNNYLPRDRYREHLRWFLRDVARSGQKIIWVGPAETRARSSEGHLRTRAYQQEFFRGGPVKWIDGWPMTVGVQHAPDGLHFTRAGYAEWTSRLVPALGASSLAAGTVIGTVLLAGALVSFFFFRR